MRKGLVPFRILHFHHTVLGRGKSRGKNRKDLHEKIVHDHTHKIFWAYNRRKPKKSTGYFGGRSPPKYPVRGIQDAYNLFLDRQLSRKKLNYPDYPFASEDTTLKGTVGLKKTPGWGSKRYCG